MKDQYYGDKRDYFKYGLVLRLLRELKLGHFSFVVMLTRADDTGHGGSVEYGVVDGAEELHQHLHESIRDEAGVVCGSRRNVRVIAPFLEARGLSCQIHDDLFTHRDRSSYFRSVRAGLTQGTVVLLDPDNGLEVGRLNAENGHRYVLFQEVKSMYDAMDNDSILAVYQHHRRVKREVFYASLYRDIQHNVAPVACGCISENVVAFITLAKTLELGQQVQAVLDRHAEAFRRIAKNTTSRPVGFGPQPLPA